MMRRSLVVSLLLLVACCSAVDQQKCDAGEPEYCPAVLRCWKGVTEVACDSVDADHSLNTFFTEEPPMNIEVEKPFPMKWRIDFKPASDGGRHPAPWVSHTNIHAAPAHLGSLAPPSGHPLRKDSISLTGGPGEYNGTMTLPTGQWLLMAHVRIQNIDDTNSDRYEITLEVVRTVGNWVKQDLTLSDEDGLGYEEFCAWSFVKFKSCDHFRSAWIWFVTGFFCLLYLSWLRTFFHLERNKAGDETLRIEYDRVGAFRMMLTAILASVIILTNDRFLGMWLETNRAPSMVNTQSVEPLTFPGILLCPFSEAGTLTVLSATHYENLYGLTAQPLTERKKISLDVQNPSDGIRFARECILFGGKNSSSQTNASSVFSTLLFKALVKDPTRIDIGGFGDAMAFLAEDEAGLQSIEGITKNIILLGQSKATFTAIQKSVQVDLRHDESTTYGISSSILNNPYDRTKDAACTAEDGDTTCHMEVVFAVNFKDMATEYNTEKITLDLFTVATMMVGVISGSRMILELSSSLFKHTLLSYARSTQRIVLWGEPDPLPPKFRGPTGAQGDALKLLKKVLHRLDSETAQESDDLEIGAESQLKGRDANASSTSLFGAFRGASFWSASSTSFRKKEDDAEKEILEVVDLFRTVLDRSQGISQRRMSMRANMSLDPLPNSRAYEKGVKSSYYDSATGVAHVSLSSSVVAAEVEEERTSSNSSEIDTPNMRRLHVLPPEAGGPSVIVFG